MAWTTPRTWAAAEVVTAALLNTHLRDNLDFLALFNNDTLATDSGSSISVSAASFTQLTGISASLTTRANANRDSAVLMLATVNYNTAVTLTFDFYNATTAAVLSVFPQEFAASTNGQITLFGVDRPAAGSNEYQVRGKVSSSSATVNSIDVLVLELA